MPSVENLKDLYNQIKAEIIPFKNSEIMGKLIIGNHYNAIGVETQFGNFIAETPMKASKEQNVILQIKDIIFPEKNSLNDLSSDLDLDVPIKNIKQLYSFLSENKNIAKNDLMNAINILKSSDINVKNEIMQPILNKLPNFNENLLPNIW